MAASPPERTSERIAATDSVISREAAALRPKAASLDSNPFEANESVRTDYFAVGCAGAAALGW